MPIPTVEDLYAFQLLESSPKDLLKSIQQGSGFENCAVRGAESVRLRNYPYEDGKYQEQVFGGKESMSRATLVCIILNRRAGRDTRSTVVAPISDELWELKGKWATAGDMLHLIAGGKEAAGFRKKIMDERQRNL